MLINYKDGSSRSGVIVSLNGAFMRVAPAGGEDLLEFRFENGNWLSDDCEVVSFEFPLGIGQHQDFRQEVAKALKPVERLDGYLDPYEGTTGTVN